MRMNSNALSSELRCYIASVGVSLLGMAHFLWENISGAGYTPMDDSHTGQRLKKADM